MLLLTVLRMYFLLDQISRVADEHVDKLGKKYKVGSTHRYTINFT